MKEELCVGDIIIYNKIKRTIKAIMFNSEKNNLKDPIALVTGMKEWLPMKDFKRTEK